MADEATNGSPLDTSFEKSPLRSKKFIAFLIADIGWTAILAAMLVMFRGDLSTLGWGLMMAVITVKGFVQVGMLLGQASLDKFVRVAKINASLGLSTPLKGLSVSASEEEEEAGEEEEGERGE